MVWLVLARQRKHLASHLTIRLLGFTDTILLLQQLSVWLHTTVASVPDLLQHLLQQVQVLQTQLAQTVLVQVQAKAVQAQAVQAQAVLIQELQAQVQALQARDGQQLQPKRQLWLKQLCRPKPSK